MTGIMAAKTRRPQELLMMKFAFWTGVRVSELISIGWDDIDLDRGVVRIKRANVKGYYKVPKTRGSVREVELLQPAIEAIKAQKVNSYLILAIEIRVTQEDNRTVNTERWRPVWRNSLYGNAHNSDGLFVTGSGNTI